MVVGKGEVRLQEGATWAALVLVAQKFLVVRVGLVAFRSSKFRIYDRQGCLGVRRPCGT